MMPADDGIEQKKTRTEGGFMSNNLIIVESPTKSKTITKFLGSKYTVRASMGHLRDLKKVPSVWMWSTTSRRSISISAERGT